MTNIVAQTIAQVGNNFVTRPWIFFPDPVPTKLLRAAQDAFSLTVVGGQIRRKKNRAVQRGNLAGVSE
jgi:hypothetical protein